MARFYGKVGYGTSVERPVGSGIWVDKMVEIPYYGDVIRIINRMDSLDSVQSVNEDITLNNAISIMANDYAMKNFFAIKYVIYHNVYWKVISVEVQRPRIILNLGGIYNGPKA